MNEDILDDVLKKAGKLIFIKCEAGGVVDRFSLQQLIRAVKSDNYFLIKNAHEEPIGYAIFARIGAENWRRIAANKTIVLQQYEWSEGSMHLIVDIAILPNWKAYGLSQLRAKARSLSQYAYLKNGRVKRRITNRVKRRR